LSGAVPGKVLEQLVSLVVGEMGEERLTDGVRGGGLSVGLARYSIAAQAHEFYIRHCEGLAQLVEDMGRWTFDGVVLELAQVGR
jgi:hypothetical protein